MNNNLIEINSLIQSLLMTEDISKPLSSPELKEKAYILLSKKRQEIDSMSVQQVVSLLEEQKEFIKMQERSNLLLG